MYKEANKPLPQPVGSVYGQDVQRSFRFGTFIQLTHDKVEGMTPLQVSVPALYGVTGTRISVNLFLRCGIVGYSLGSRFFVTTDPQCLDYGYAVNGE